MTLTPDLLQSSTLRLSCVWTVKERDPETGLFVPVLEVKNLWTDYGLTQLASAVQGGYSAPAYLIIDTFGPHFSATYAAGVNAVASPTRVDVAGDTQLVLSPGTARQETVTFSSVTGTGPYTYHLTGNTTQIHNVTDYLTRAPKATDTLTNVITEAQYDATNAPNQRMQSVAGYSQTTHNWTMQFYFNAGQALVNIMSCGLSESPTVGAGHLHNHFVLGYNHTSGDVEIDGSLTLTN